MKRKQKKFIVITSINHPTSAVNKFACWDGWQVVVVGDKKTPENWWAENVIYLSLDKQLELFPNLFHLIPLNSYKRKIFGYLFAVANGAEFIFDTDDDNIPYENADTVLEADLLTFGTSKELLNSSSRWINIYSYFGAEKIWPRGFPIEFITEENVHELIKNDKVKLGLIQYLADIDPDVDAIFRLTENRMLSFTKNKKVCLNTQVFCPFNSQATLWKKDYFHFMFFPLGVTDRVTDILRGYIALASLWNQNNTIEYSSSIVYQERNVHNLLKDFELEVPLYLNADRWCSKISKIIKSIKSNDNPFELILNDFVKDGILPDNNLDAYKKFIYYLYK